MSDTTTTTPAVEEPQTARASTDTPDTTPEATDTPDLGDGGKKALEKAANDLAAKVKAYEDAQKSETERLTEQLEQFKTEAATAKAETLRLRVAAESGLPADLHEFLVGDDEDQLRAKAQKLMAATAAATAPRAPAPDPTQGAKPGQGTAQLTRADLARMTPQEIVAAQESGRLDDLMAGRL